MYMCCSRLLEVAGIKKEDAPLTWKLSEEAKAVFAEVDESDITKDHDRESLQGSLCSYVADTLRHNPYVDSSLPLFEGSHTHRTGSCDALEDVASKGDSIEHYGEGPMDGKLLKNPNVRNHERRGSDPAVVHPCERKPNRVQLEPLNLSNRQTNNRGKQTPSQSLEANCNDGERIEVDSSSISLKQSAGHLAETDRIQVAKSMASSACADSSVHSRTERIKVH